MNKNFWKNKKPDAFTQDEWEALCDHCGKCCLHKIEDEETGKIYVTYVACKYLEIKTCKCKVYDRRHEVNPDCLRLEPDSIKNINWLPDTCTYRLIFEGRELPLWHPLISKDPDSTNKANKSVIYIAIPEKDVDSIENHIIIEF